MQLVDVKGGKVEPNEHDMKQVGREGPLMIWYIGNQTPIKHTVTLPLRFMWSPHPGTLHAI